MKWHNFVEKPSNFISPMNYFLFDDILPSRHLLVGGAITILKNMKVNGKDYPIYYGKLKNVPNHQPVYIYIIILIVDTPY